MRSRHLAALLACAPPLGGCAYIGLAPALVDAVNNSTARRYVGEDFEAAAAEACAARASRYGRVTIGTVQSVSDSVVRVSGSLEEATRQRNFTCDFASNGRIAEFRRDHEVPL
jgi:hypothetical protein